MKMSNVAVKEKRPENVQMLHFNWTGFAPSALSIKSSNSSLIKSQTIRTGIQSSRIFFNQTSKQLIFIEQPFGVEPTLGFLCWFRMLLLSLVSFLCLARLQFLSNSLSLTQFRSLEGAFHLHLTKAQEQAPSKSDWSSLNHKFENSWTPWPVYKRMQW